jgi:hypothetical protein
MSNNYSTLIVDSGQRALNGPRDVMGRRRQGSGVISLMGG